MGPKAIKKSESNLLKLNGIKQFNSVEAMEDLTQNYGDDTDIDDVLVWYRHSRYGGGGGSGGGSSSSSSFSPISIPSLTSPKKRLRIDNDNEAMDIEKKKKGSRSSEEEENEEDEEDEIEDTGQRMKRKRVKSGKPRKMNEENIAYFARKYMDEVEKPTNPHMMYEKYQTTKIGGGHQIYMRFIRWLTNDQFETVCKRGGDDGGFRSVTKAVHQYMQEKFNPEQVSSVTL